MCWKRPPRWQTTSWIPIHPAFSSTDSLWIQQKHYYGVLRLLVTMDVQFSVKGMTSRTILHSIRDLLRHKQLMVLHDNQCPHDSSTKALKVTIVLTRWSTTSSLVFINFFTSSFINASLLRSLCITHSEHHLHSPLWPRSHLMGPEQWHLLSGHFTDVSSQSIRTLHSLAD